MLDKATKNVRPSSTGPMTRPGPRIAYRGWGFAIKAGAQVENTFARIAASSAPATSRAPLSHQSPAFDLSRPTARPAAQRARSGKTTAHTRLGPRRQLQVGDPAG